MILNLKEKETKKSDKTCEKSKVEELGRGGFIREWSNFENQPRDTFLTSQNPE